MSEQVVDLQSPWAVLRRHIRTLAVAGALGALVGGALLFLLPAQYSSTSEVLFPATPPNSSGQASTHDIATQVQIALSDVVLGPAGQSIGSGLSAEEVAKRVEITSPTADILKIVAKGASSAEAQEIASAVATADVAFAGAGANVIQQATPAVRTPLVVRAPRFMVIGAMAALLVTAFVVVRRGRKERTLRSRDQIADAVGVPVVAALQSRAPRSVSGWTSLLQSYAPGSSESWTLRRLLRLVTPGSPGSLAGPSREGSRPTRVAVLTLADDLPALGIGPQFASFAASTGTVTQFVIAQRPHESANALKVACSRLAHEVQPRPGLTVDNRENLVQGPANRQQDGADGPQSRKWMQARLVRVPGDPAGDGVEEVGSNGDAGAEGDSGGDLIVYLIVLDRRSPELHLDDADTVVTLLAVTSGAATPDDLARIAAVADDAGRPLSGVVVVDPDPLDRTTGRVLESERAQQVTLQSRPTASAIAGELPESAARRRPR